MVLRLRRLPCGKPLAFRQDCNSFCGCAAEAKPHLYYELTESQRLSARVAAKPQEQNPEAFRKNKTPEAFCTGGGEVALARTKPQRLSTRQGQSSKPIASGGDTDQD